MDISEDEAAAAEAALATPLGSTFRRLFTEDGFAAAVAEDPDAALAGCGLSATQMEAIASDAESLEGEVSGFVFAASPVQLMQRIGGLRTPGILGVRPATLAWGSTISLV